MTAPQLIFEFASKDGNIEPKLFRRPVRILEANETGEVRPLLEEVEKAVNEGYYAAGFLSYEAAPAFHSVMAVHENPSLPLAWFGIFNAPETPDAFTEEAYETSEWQLDSPPGHYANGIRRIKQAIEEGETYQVNYTERMHTEFKGSARSFWQQLARNQQADFSAYLDLGDTQILSASPELFFRLDGGVLTAKPMKGTAARGRTLEEDLEQIRKLVTSPKERAENLMIVDLLRNDMSRLAEDGTVRVPKLFETEKYPTVHQLTSTVEAEVAKDKTIFDWFQALFPCGSITGAPKISTMKFIHELERSPREVYCGAIGFITPEKDAVFNVPIRTVIIDQEKGTAQYGVGGGVTWDSTSEGEFEELMTKAEILKAKRPEFRLLESLKLKDGTYPLIHRHLERLKRSAEYVHFPGNNEGIMKELEKVAKKHPSGTFKVRLLLSRSGDIEVQADEIVPITGPVHCSLALEPVDSRNPFLFHKTTHRGMYEREEARQPAGNFSPLLWNEKGEATEFTIGNFVAEKDGEFYTPPIDCGVLAGVMREQLLSEGRLRERVILKAELSDFDAFWLINGVRGWVKVQLE